jgi:starch phosphorylase
MESVLGAAETAMIEPFSLYEGRFNLTYLALNLSRYVNGVAKRHAEISQHLFSTYEIHAITNGVHAATWTSRSVAGLFDRHIPGWRADPSSLRYAINIAPEELWEAHQVNKSHLIACANELTGAGLVEDVLTLGFGRRMTSYKRATLILHDLDRLHRIGQKSGPLQFIFAGKAHPADEAGKHLVQQLVHSSKSSDDAVRTAFLPNYDLRLARLMTSGADIWLNTPQPPLEASGTSGMKAALNGVPSLSVLDGWWLEGCIEGITGWAIADGIPWGEMRDWTAEHASSLYEKIEEVVLPMFYHDLRQFQNIMRQAIALNGSFFNTNRMMQEYGAKAYL